MKVIAGKSFPTPRSAGMKSSRFIKGPVSVSRRKELKFIDTDLSSGVFNTTGVVIPLNLTATGDDYSNRDGRQVTVKSVVIHGFATKGASVVPEKDRWLLVWDNAANGALAAVSDILASVSANSAPNVNNQNRFTILRDSMNFTNANGAQVEHPSFLIEYFTKINEVTQYSGTTAAIGSVQNGALLFVTVGTAAATAATMTGTARVRFVDM